jgi:hypothetical protein
MHEYSVFNQQQYPYCQFACMGIDKIAFGIDNRYLTRRDTPEFLKQKIDIITYGNYSILNFQGEHINPGFPLQSISLLLIEAAFFGIFRYDYAYHLYTQCNLFLSGFWHPQVFIEKVIINGPFKWDELEIYFDFYGETLPFRIQNRKHFINVNGTLYTKDYRKLYRPAKNPDGTQYWQKKGLIRSIFALYDRGKKLAETDQGYPVEPITRLEIRICDRKAKSLLHACDLWLTLESFIDQNCNKILKKVINAHFPPDTIYYDDDFINEYVPYLKKLIPGTYQPDISSTRQQVFSEKATISRKNGGDINR